MKIYFIGGDPPERIINMKILIQNLCEVVEFNSERMTILLELYNEPSSGAAIIYGGFLSKSFKIVGVYKNEKRAKEVAEDMLKKNENGEKVYIMPEE